MNDETTNYTVSELVQKWNDGDLSVENGNIDEVDEYTLEVVFPALDGKLGLVYDLSENLAWRSDGTTRRFTILDE